jgi:BirA family biotin operon repressor/biotin-[acetyl-CoA-carboxylase] ligase
LPLVVGVAVAEAIEAVSGLPCRLKWPNDVWLGDGTTGRKVAGILLTSRLAGATVDHAVVGVGINVAVPATDLPPGATSLAVEANRAIGVEDALERLLARLDAGYRVYLEAAGAPSLAPWRARAALLGEAVAVAVAGERREGIMRGVDDDGALLLEATDGSVARIVAGELVRGPVLQDSSTAPILRSRRGSDPGPQP